MVGKLGYQELLWKTGLGRYDTEGGMRMSEGGEPSLFNVKL